MNGTGLLIAHTQHSLLFLVIDEYPPCWSLTMLSLIAFFAMHQQHQHVAPPPEMRGSSLFFLLNAIVVLTKEKLPSDLLACPALWCLFACAGGNNPALLSEDIPQLAPLSPEE